MKNKFNHVLILSLLSIFLLTSFTEKSYNSKQTNSQLSGGEWMVCISIENPAGSNIFQEGRCSTACGFQAAKQCAADLTIASFPNARIVGVSRKNKVAPTCW